MRSAVACLLWMCALPCTCDHYAVLGVSHDADQAAIKAAYRRKALRHHPGVLQPLNLCARVLTQPPPLCANPTRL